MAEKVKVPMRTKNDCLLAIVDAYGDLVGRPITMDEVAEWQIGRGLVTIPKRGSSPALFSEFSSALTEAKRKGLLADEQSPKRKLAESFQNSEPK